MRGISIDSIVQTDYEVVSPYAGVNSIRRKLRRHSALVVSEESYVGLLTANDLVSKSHNLVGDCLTEKKAISASSDLSEVIELFESEKAAALPVKQEQEFIGVVFLRDIQRYLMQEKHAQNERLENTLHDVNSIISRMHSFGKIMASEGVSPEEKEKFLEMLEADCHLMTSIARDCISPDEQTSNQQGEMGNGIIDLKPVLSPLLNSFEFHSKHKKDVQLSSHFPDEDIHLKIPGLKVKQVLQNLLSNALKFSPRGSEIRLTVTPSADDRVTISVKDSGIGISDELKPHLFKKRSVAQRKGLEGELSNGLGLYFVKRTVEQYGGAVKIESEENKGTEVIVELPLADVNDQENSE